MAKILIVDDSKTIREIIRIVLTKNNHTVISANGGVEALALAQSTTVDLALIDLNMPNMNGLSLISELRNLENYKFIPILIVTTETDESQKKKAHDVGATGWLTKPFTADRLEAAVNRLLK